MMTASQSHQPTKLFPSILALLLLTSCSHTQGKSKMTDYEPKLNPNPTQRYDFTVTLIEAPTNLVVTNIWAIYESNCEQLVDKWAGAYKELTKEFALEFHKIKPNVYQATVFGDKLLDESRPDGMECRWKLSHASIRLDPSPNVADIHYSSSVGMGTNHYVSDGYWKYEGYITRYRFNEPSTEGHSSLGVAISKNMFGPIQKQQLATIRLELRRK